jgi:hypothetical protein
MYSHILHWGIYLSIIRCSLPFKQQNNYTKFFISSNLVSLTHALGTIGGSAYILYNNPSINNFDGLDKNSLALITFSSSYFIYDLIIMMFTNINILFILHHLLILMVYYITITYNYSAKFVILSIFWGEITNPLQITWRLSNKLNYKKLENFVFPVFSFNFIIVRTIVVPLMQYSMLSTMFENKDYYYPTIGLSILSILGNIGGILWTKQIYNKLVK